MKQEKGITLVALVITIIILLLLAGISIRALGDVNLFGKTKDAGTKWNAAEKNEETTLNNYTDVLNDYLK